MKINPKFIVIFTGQLRKVINLKLLKLSIINEAVSGDESLLDTRAVLKHPVIFTRAQISQMMLIF